MSKPNTEQMLADLKGKIPEEVHALLIEAGQRLDAMERRQFARMLHDNGDGTFRIAKPPRYTLRA